MNMLQLLGGVAVAGVVAAGSTAFTGTGLVTSVAASQFIGGTVSQGVTGGASLTGITYGYSDATHTIINKVDLTFTAGTATGKTVTVAGTGGTGFVGTTHASDVWTCPTGADSISCTIKLTGGADVSLATDGYDGLTSLAVTVA